MILLKKTEYDKLVAKVNNTDTSWFVLKTKYNTDKSELENKLPNTSGLVKKRIMTLKLPKLRTRLIITIMINILLLKNLII